MRILMVHNFYQQPGGEDQSFAAEVEMLRRRGVEVVTWTVHNDDIEAIPPARLALNTIWNREAAREFRARHATDGPFDVVHFQNTFPQISPAAIWAAGQSRSAVVQTLRNYRLLCVNGLFFRDGKACELCIDRRLQLPGIRYACYRSSIPASATVAAMNYYGRVKRVHEQSVDAFIALSAFARSKYVHTGLDAQRILVKPNFVAVDPGIGRGSGHYAIFVGRLSPEKGVRTLLNAWDHIGTKLPLKIVGDGPLAEQVRTAAANSNGGIEWLGRKARDVTEDLIGDASLLIFPSECYETFGRVAIEAYAKGTPVIAANIGAIAELVEEGETGLRFEPGLPLDLAAKVETFLKAQDAPHWRTRARQEFERKYTSDSNYETLMTIYAGAIARKRGA